MYDCVISPKFFQLEQFCGIVYNESADVDCSFAAWSKKQHFNTNSVPTDKVTQF